MLTTEIEIPQRLWTVEEYYRMAEVGILQPDESVELIEGKIIRNMSPQRSHHAGAISFVEICLKTLLGEDVLVRSQRPIRLNNYSEPEPDVAVVIPDARYYFDRHPQAEDVYLIVEVADTTLKTDSGARLRQPLAPLVLPGRATCQLKANIYAASGIADYWVWDINNGQLHVFREPTENGFSNRAILTADEVVSPLAFPGVTVAVKDFLPPVIDR